MKNNDLAEFLRSGKPIPDAMREQLAQVVEALGKWIDLGEVEAAHQVLTKLSRMRLTRLVAAYRAVKHVGG